MNEPAQLTIRTLFVYMSLAAVGATMYSMPNDLAPLCFVIVSAATISSLSQNDCLRSGTFAATVASLYMTCIYFVITAVRYANNDPPPPQDGPFMDLVMAPMFLVIFVTPFAGLLGCIVGSLVAGARYIQKKVWHPAESTPHNNDMHRSRNSRAGSDFVG